MEESKLNPKESNSTEFSPNLENGTKEEKIKDFTEFLEKASNQVKKDEKGKFDLKEKTNETKDNSLFKRILNDGFDGISSNPNYKMLALLIILLINLSLFFVIGNIGKAFLKKAGIM